MCCKAQGNWRTDVPGNQHFPYNYVVALATAIEGDDSVDFVYLVVDNWWVLGKQSPFPGHIIYYSNFYFVPIGSDTTDYL